jgi:hypothetical protein
MKLPWWYQSTETAENNSIDRPFDSGISIIPQQIEIRDGGVFWSFDPEHEIPRPDPHSDDTSQILQALRISFKLLFERRSGHGKIFEADRISLMNRMKYKGKRSSPDRRCLTQFLELQESNAEAVLQFANDHGVLDICEHGLSHGHHRWCAPNGWPIEGWTSLRCWQRTAQRFAAILKIASDLKEDRRSSGRAEDWKIVLSSVVDEEVRKRLTVPSREVGLNMLEAVVNDYIRVGEVHPSLARTPAGWKLFFAGNPLYPLFGRLALQLALIICGADAMYTCSGCGSLYLRHHGRRPKVGTRNYCSSCGKRKALSDAKRSYLAKKAEAGELRSQGIAVSEIARRLHSDPARVRKWVRAVDDVREST